MLVYLPRSITVEGLCDLFGIKANINFAQEKLIRTVMTDEDQWFITSNTKTPELIYKSGNEAKRIYEDEGLHGLDLRRYLAFVGYFHKQHGHYPDSSYWTFLHSGSYDRSGISVVGFDRFGTLNHHGWMRDFKSKFTGSRYCVIAPRLEVTTETSHLSRARRGVKGKQYREASTD